MIRDFIAIDFETANQQPPVVTTFRIIIMPWPMLKPVPQ
jgi:hypothetical protein